MLVESALAFAFGLSLVKKLEREETAFWQYINTSNIDKRFVWDNAALPMIRSLMRT
jgi:hypothetical protein